MNGMLIPFSEVYSSVSRPNKHRISRMVANVSIAFSKFQFTSTSSTSVNVGITVFTEFSLFENCVVRGMLLELDYNVLSILRVRYRFVFNPGALRLPNSTLDEKYNNVNSCISLSLIQIHNISWLTPHIHQFYRSFKMLLPYYR